MTAEQHMRFADTPDLLLTKLLPPRPHTPLVAREALLAQFDTAITRKLTLCTAPAGFGKTTLIGQWLAARTDRPGVRAPSGRPSVQPSALNPRIAWVSLDAGDNDPARFWRYATSACQSFRAGFGQTALARLQATEQRPFEQPALEPALTALLNDAAALPYQGVLVLEDYHVITSARIHQMLAFVIDRLPPQLHLIVISRNEPPLPLARLRASADLCELHAEDLRFTTAEIGAFAAQALSCTLPPELIARLEQRTEGWAAGLRLAMIALRGRSQGEIELLLDAFSGSQPPVADYLVAEVLQAQPEPIQSFLLETSILSRLTASLCNAVGMRNDSAELLAWIEQANLFLLPLDEIQGWYRYHALFAEAMQHEAYRRLGEGAVRACLARASAWYEQQGMLADAIDTALAAKEWQRAATLMEPIVEALHIAKPREPHTVRRWLEQLPEAFLHQRPALCFGYAFALLHTSGRPPAIVARIEELGQLAEQGWRCEGNLPKLGPLFAARALFALWTGQIERAIGWARQALGWLPATDVLWRGICLGFVGKAELDAGQLDAARQTLLEARALSEASHIRHAARAHTIGLAHACAGQGELHQAAALYDQALADALDGADLSDQGPARLGLARLAYEQNDLEAANREAQAACEIGKQLADTALQAQARLLLARIQHARNAPERARQQIAALLAQVSPHHTRQLYREVLMHQARLQLAAGDLRAAQRWSAARTHDSATGPQHLQEQEEILRARLLIAQGRAEDSLPMLDQLRSGALASGRLRSALEIQMLAAQAYAACGRVEAASQALREALAQAHTASYCRLFLDEGEALIGLLRGLVPTLREPAQRGFAQTLVQAFMLEQGAPEPAEPLSRQEQRVLRLLAAGRSNPEIAQELVVSVNTVKTQLKQIYRKLNVSSRQEARTIAGHLRLL
jgi:LuxR family maltose regulon positive regulatory protein